MRALEPTLREFQSDLAKTRSLFDGIAGAAAAAGLRHGDLETYQSICVVRMTLGWESFLEEAVLKHMCGCRAVGGTWKPKTSTFTTTTAAFAHLLGTRDFLSWSYFPSVQNVERALGPVHQWASDLRGSRQDLLDIYAVRNRIAHRSESTAVAFRDVVVRRLGSFPRGMTPGRFLRRPTATHSSFMHQWLDTIEALAMVMTA